MNPFSYFFYSKEDGDIIYRQKQKRLLVIGMIIAIIFIIIEFNGGHV